MELSINNVTKQFKVKKAVDDISFSMKNGVYGLLGVNGAGKTTLMRMLCTLTTPDCGMITWDGKDIFKMGASYRQILGYLPQDFGYYPYLTIYDYMMYIASIKGIRPAVAKKRTKELLKQVGLSDQKKQKMRRQKRILSMLSISENFLQHARYLSKKDRMQDLVICVHT